MIVYHWVIIALGLVIAGQLAVSAMKAEPAVDARLEALQEVIQVDIQRFVEEEAGVVIWVGRAYWCDPRWGCDVAIGMFGLPIYETDLADATPVVVPVPIAPTMTWAVPTGEYMTNTPTATPGEPTQEPIIFTPTPTLTITPIITATATITP